MLCVPAHQSGERLLKNASDQGKLQLTIFPDQIHKLISIKLVGQLLLTCVFVCIVIGRDFQAGELGPGTIVGSAAFNLFVIISICIYVIPDDELRRIKHLRVFFVTASWSLVAYIWLYLMIAQISPGEIHVSNTLTNEQSQVSHNPKP